MYEGFDPGREAIREALCALGNGFFTTRGAAAWAHADHGIEVSGDVLPLSPQLPEEVDRLDMRIRYRGHSLDLPLTRDTLTVRGHAHEAPPIRLPVKGEMCEFAGNGARVFRLGSAAR